ncbi:MAG: heme-binding beta-barrel domain-containing protein [Acidimicrobiales bacterium]
MTLGAELGPLEGLVGEWEGDQGLDEAYANLEGKVVETPFREKSTFSPFGPVENGRQVLYGLDYRTAAWRDDEEDPFHTEVGYWLWDADDGQVMRCFMVPRGSTVLAGGPASATDTSFVLRAEVGSEVYGILSNRFLAEAARAVRYEATVTVGEGTFTYAEQTEIEHKRLDELLIHTDRNTLHRVGGPGPRGEVSVHRD